MDFHIFVNAKKQCGEEQKIHSIIDEKICLKILIVKQRKK